MQDDPGFVASSLITLRLMLAWACLAVGVLDLGMGVDLPADGAYLVFHVVLLLTGLVLMGWGRLRGSPGRIGLAAGGLVVVAGLAVSAGTDFPFPIGGADAVFWVCAGFLALAAVTLVRPAAAPPAHAAPAPAHAHHAEKRAAEAPVAHDENVGGLP